MDKNGIIHHILKDKKEDVVHSSAYAQAQNTGIGASSTQSFEKRREIDQNRTTVRGYKESEIMNEPLNNAPRPKIYDPSIDKTSSKGSYKDLVEKRAEFNASASQFGMSRGKEDSDSKPSSTIGNRFQALPDRGTKTPPPRRNPGIMR